MALSADALHRTLVHLFKVVGSYLAIVTAVIKIGDELKLIQPHVYAVAAAFAIGGSALAVAVVLTERRNAVPHFFESKVTWIVLAVGLIVTAAFSVFPLPPRRNAVAVKPFDAITPDSLSKTLALGIAYEVATTLGRDPDLRVMDPHSVFADTFSPAQDAHSVAQRLRVEYVVRGAVESGAARLYVIPTLFDAKGSQPIWSQRYDGPTADPFLLQSNIADALVREVTQRLRFGNRAPRQPQDSAALRLYYQARAAQLARTSASLKTALDLFSSAVKRDPTFADAWAGIGATQALLAYYGWADTVAYSQAATAAQQALLLEPTSAEAHAARGLVLSRQDWRWTEAEQEFRIALKLNPSYSAAHAWLGGDLLERGNVSAAIAQLAEAAALDPSWPPAHTALGEAYVVAEDFNKAEEQFRIASHSPDDFEPGAWLVRLFLAQRRCADAAAKADSLALDWGDNATVRLLKASVAACRGSAAAARAAIADVRRLFLAPDVSEFLVAVADAQLGDRDAALAALQVALDRREPLITSIKVDPSFASLRSDPRFNKIVRAVGLN